MPSSTVYCGAAFLAALALSLPAPAQDRAPFRFEQIDSLEAMRNHLREAFPPGAPRALLRTALAEEGGAGYRRHPRQAASDKYLYDINLCDLYIWRWNISADFDAADKLAQVYVNGDPVHAAGPQKRDGFNGPDGKPRSPQQRASIIKGVRHRPEAHRGEKQLVYIALDTDADPGTVDDQLVMGAGPSRPELSSKTRLYAYKEVDLWRSIFDPDPADRIIRSNAPCPVAPGG